MLKNIARNMLIGFAVTIFIVLVVQIFVAHTTGMSATPRFAAMCGNETVAALAQALLCGLIGMTFSGAALIFEIERWSYLKQGVVHFLVTAAVWVPVSLLCWMPSMMNVHFWISIGGWVFTYAVNWLIQYFIARHRIAEMNRRIGEFQKSIREEAE